MKVIAGMILLVAMLMSTCSGNEPSSDTVPTDSTETVDSTFTPTEVDSVDVSLQTDSTSSAE